MTGYKMGNNSPFLVMLFIFSFLMRHGVTTDLSRYNPYNESEMVNYQHEDGFMKFIMYLLKAIRIRRLQAKRLESDVGNNQTVLSPVELEAALRDEGLLANSWAPFKAKETESLDGASGDFDISEVGLSSQKKDESFPMTSESVPEIRDLPTISTKKIENSGLNINVMGDVAKNCSDVYRSSWNFSGAFPKLSNQSNGYSIKLSFAGYVIWEAETLNYVICTLYDHFEDFTYDNVQILSVYSGPDAFVTWFNKSISICDSAKLNNLSGKLFGNDTRISAALRERFGKMNVSKVEVVVEEYCLYRRYSRLDALSAAAIPLIMSVFGVIFLIYFIACLRKRFTGSMAKHFTRPTRPVILVGEAGLRKCNGESPRQPSVLHSDYAGTNCKNSLKEKPMFESFRYTDTDIV